MNVVALDDDYAYGILSSGIHELWARKQSSTFKGDIRYTPTSVFATFPWPEPAGAVRERIGELARRLTALRRELCTGEGVGLTTLYNRVEEGAYQDLTEVHRELDEAVCAAYGWRSAAVRDPEQIVSRLTELNTAIGAGTAPYAPFGGATPLTLPVGG